MATGRISGASLKTGAVGRISGATATATATASAVGRISGASLAATANAVGRITGATLIATVAGDVTTSNLDRLEPGVPITVTPVIVGVTPTSISWTCNYPDAIDQVQINGTLTYKPPATRDGVDLTWTVTITYPGGTLTDTATHTVLPHAGGWMCKADRSGLYPVLVGAVLPGVSSVPATVTPNV